MKIEVSRRRFLQGSVALTVAGSTSLPNVFAGSAKQSKTLNKNIYNTPTVCEMCVNKCAAIAYVENGIVKKLEPNPLFPKSRNMLCARGQAGIHALYDPDRLKYPLIRNGKRGNGNFKRVSWDEANEYIKEKLVNILDQEKNNRSCIAYCAGEGLAEHTFRSFMNDKFGSANFLNHSSICLQTTVSAHALTLGGYGQADLQNAQYVIMAGANRAEAFITPDSIDLFKRTRGRGVKLVVIDPRFTNTAMHADEYLAIKSGTDLAFVLALTYHVLVNELYNRKYVENQFTNFEKYRDHIINYKYTPKWAEKITGIKAKVIARIAEEFMAYAPQSIYYQGRRTTWTKNDFQLRRAQAIFTALGGGIDIKGGITFGKTLPLNSHEINTPLYSNAKPRIDADQAAVISTSGSWVAWRNMVENGKTPYPIRGMFVYKQNPMLSVPNTNRTKKMFEKMDLVVVIDTIPSDTAIMADVILPECTYLEREDPIKSFGGIEPAIVLRQKVIEPMYESKPVLEIIYGLTKKISKPLWELTKKYDQDVQDELTESEDEHEYYQENGFDLTDGYLESQQHINELMFVPKYGTQAWQILRNKGVYYPKMASDLKKINANEYQYYQEQNKFYSVLKFENEESCSLNDSCNKIKDIAEIKRIFPTASKKIECYLGNFEKKGIPPMPVWIDEDFAKTPDDKFLFIHGRHATFTQNATQNNIVLLELMNQNYLWINNLDAKNLNIEFGDEVEITSSKATVRIKAFPTPKINKKTVFYIHGFGSKSSGLSFAHNNGASDNEIIEDEIEPVYGSAITHETMVTIKKV